MILTKSIVGLKRRRGFEQGEEGLKIRQMRIHQKQEALILASFESKTQVLTLAF